MLAITGNREPNLIHLSGLMASRPGFGEGLSERHRGSRRLFGRRTRAAEDEVHCFSGPTLEEDSIRLSVLSRGPSSNPLRGLIHSKIAVLRGRTSKLEIFEIEELPSHAVLNGVLQTCDRRMHPS